MDRLINVMDPSTKMDQLINAIDPSGPALKVDKWLKSLTVNQQYFAKVILLIPLMYFVHLWLLFAPASNYTILEVLFVVFRYLLAFFVQGVWVYETDRLLVLYARLFLLSIFGYSIFHSYELFEAESESVCLEGSNWILAVVAYFTIQVLYTFYFIRRYDEIREEIQHDVGKKGIYLLAYIFLIPYLISSFKFGFYIIDYIYYYLSRAMFTILAATVLIDSGMGSPLETKQLPKLPGNFFMRDIHIAFTLIYFTGVIVYEAGNQGLVNIAFSELIGKWCTSIIILWAICALCAILSNAIIAAAMFIVKGERNLKLVFDANIGVKVQQALFFFAIEAGLMVSTEEERADTMKIILLLAFFVIVAHIWDITEPYLLGLSLDVGQNIHLTRLKVVIFCTFLIVTSPILCIYASDYLEMDRWLMLNATGCTLVTFRGMVSVAEFFLLLLSAQMDIEDWFEKAIYCVKVAKNLGGMVLIIMTGYYRLFAPFFGSWMLLRGSCVVYQLCNMAYKVCLKEWNTYQARRECMGRVELLDKVTREDIDRLDDVCPICYASMEVGSARKTPCGHMFHAYCLRKWFVVKTICPLDNKEIFPRIEQQPPPRAPDGHVHAE